MELFEWVDCHQQNVLKKNYGGKKKKNIGLHPCILLLDLVYYKAGITLHFVHKSILVHDFNLHA